jgi:hypothetical protein
VPAAGPQRVQELGADGLEVLRRLRVVALDERRADDARAGGIRLGAAGRPERVEGDLTASWNVAPRMASR